MNIHWGPRELCRNLASYRTRHGAQMEKRAHTLPTTIPVQGGDRRSCLDSSVPPHP